MAADDLQKLIARENQLGNRGHQLIEGVDSDADGMARNPLAFIVVTFGRGFVSRWLFDRLLLRQVSV